LRGGKVIHFLFEDNEQMPICQLLLHSDYGEYIHFSNGNYQLTTKAYELLDSDGVDKVYIFIDCPPNEYYVRRTYEAICLEFARNEDVEIFPIICLEEITLKMLNIYYKIPYAKTDFNLVNNIVFMFNWKNVEDKFKNDLYIGKSLEHAYKHILSNLTVKCLHNQDDGIRGKFYLKDCNCERKYCNVLNSEDCLDIKAERLYTSLPLCIPKNDEVCCVWNEIGIHFKKQNVETVKSIIRDKYKVICESMEVENIEVC
jgi:hypothetical protein